MHNEEIIDKLKQISESIQIIQEWHKEKKSVSDLLSSPWGTMALDASIMRIQVIGENIRSIDDKTNHQLFNNYPQIPWRKVIGLRNIISHEYANVDYDIIWGIITTHLPTMQQVINQIIADLKS